LLSFNHTKTQWKKKGGQTMRFIIQELKCSGYTYYEVIDTENNCTCCGIAEKYNVACDFAKWLEMNKDMPIYYAGKKL
jgi:hypothetical protein